MSRPIVPNPYRTVTYTCAVCKNTSTETKGWLVAKIHKKVFVLLSFEDKHLNQPDSIPLCGPTCAHKAQAVFIEGLQI